MTQSLQNISSTLDTLLSVAFTGSLSCEYSKVPGASFGCNTTFTGVNNDANQIRGDINYNELKTFYNNGDGANLANLLFQRRRTLAPGITHAYNLDGGMQNIWGQTLNFDSIKLVIIVNRTSGEYRKLLASIKNDTFVIGPQGKRIIIEPQDSGLGAVYDSNSSEEGGINIGDPGSNDGDVEYDLIVVGSRFEDSSSSGN